jgi:hypothetical protein
MDPFYKTVVIVAIVMLILAFVGLGVIMQEQDGNTEYPPQQNSCPDHWISTGDNCKINTDSGGTELNVGNFSHESDDYMTYTDVSGVKTVTFNSSLLVCDKKKWANKYNIVWDGVSNYNQC